MSPRAKSGKKVLAEETLDIGVPLVLAARQLLRPRFDDLGRALEELRGSRLDDPKPNHNLRVVTRRCAVANCWEC
jgi:hypothetical protein